MNLIPALLALTSLAAPGSAPRQQGYGTVTLAGRVVRLEFPTSPIRQLSDDVKNWDGFAYAPASSRTWPDVFPTPGDWAPIGSRFLSVTAPATPTVWRTKVVIVTQSDLLSEYPDKLIHQDRSRLDADQVTTILSALARYGAWVKADTNGALNVSLDVSIDSEPMYLGEGGLNLKEYLQARFNGGKFESEDKVYRGPYNSVVVIHPGLRYGVDSAEVNGTACYSIPFFQTWLGGDDPAATNLEAALMINTVYQLEKERARFGMPAAVESSTLAVGVPSLTSVVESGDWADFASLEDLPFERLSALAKKGTVQGSADSQATQIFRLAPASPNVTLSIVTDPEKGQVLKYAEKAPVRLGGFALPKADLSKASVLRFSAKSSSRDGLVLRTFNGQKVTEFPLNGFVADGKWHQVAISVSSDAQWLSLGPTEFENRSEKIEPGTIEYQFADFQLGNEIATSSAGPSEEIVRAGQASSLSAEALKSDSSDLVKLNGLIRHTGAYDAKDEAALIELAHSANARIAEAAITQLAKLGTPSAKAEVVRLIASSPFERVKQVAALEVGKMGDPKLAGAMSLLFASKNWQTRLAGAKGIAMLPGDEPAIILMTFLQETDPQIRLAVTEGANTANSVVLKRLLWSAVNDPSDAVRAASCLRLIFSGKAREAAEGYKGIRDDSIWVRIAILKGLAAKPDEAHRGALRIAVVDLSPRVRAEALTAFATLKEVSLDEISNTLEDKYPVVQRALIQLAKAKNLVLPKNAVDNLKASIDPKIVEMAREVGN